MADLSSNATPAMDIMTWRNSTSDTIDLPKTVSLIVIFICSLFGNLCTIVIVGKFKQRKLPDVLVIGLACTDLIATFIPVPMTLYSYVTLEQFPEGSFACNFYGTVAQFTRYASVLIVTLISLERYFAVNRPFIYRKHATPLRCGMVLICCWIGALVLALVPVIHSGTTISSHDGFCLFDFSSHYAIILLVYGGVQFLIVLLCFLLVICKLFRVYQRRKKLRVQGTINERSKAKEREHEVTFTKPKLTSRISDFRLAIKKAAPMITEKFQFGVEAQFARMLFAVVALFYVSWTTIVILICVAQAKGSEDGLSLAKFWGIRFTVISLALNPILYGLLARQYRLAYWYVLKSIFSRCCCRCVEPPETDIFATARTPGGEVQGASHTTRHTGTRLQEKKYDSQSHRSMNGSLWSGQAGQPILTNTTHLSLDLLPQLEEGEYVSSIQESINDHSTFIPSVGELSSTVVIPHQAREYYNQDTPEMEHSHPRTLSEHDLTDVGHSGTTPSDKHAAGSHNPLAIIADIEGEKAITEQRRAEKHFPPLETLDPQDPTTGKVYHNPVYDLEKRRKEKEALCLSRSSPVAALRSSQKPKIKATYSWSTDCNSTARQSQEQASVESSRPALGKRPVMIARSSPLSLLRGSKKQKLKARYTLPPTLDPKGGQIDESNLDVVVDCGHLTPPNTSKPGQKYVSNATRASARTYNEVIRNSNSQLPSRPISSSHSFVDSPLSSVKRDESMHTPLSQDAAVTLAPRYQISLSPTLPPAPTQASTTPSPKPSPRPSPHMTQKKPTLPSAPTNSVSTNPVIITPPEPHNRGTPSDNRGTPSHNMQLYSPSKGSSVKKLRQRFESLSSTPPTSPISLASPSPASYSSHLTPQHHYTDTELDSGRESMVELVVTDI